MVLLIIILVGVIFILFIGSTKKNEALKQLKNTNQRVISLNVLPKSSIYVFILHFLIAVSIELSMALEIS